MAPLEGQRDVPKDWWYLAQRWAHLAWVRQQYQARAWEAHRPGQLSCPEDLGQKRFLAQEVLVGD